MSKRIDHLARLSVARGCGFALIALVTMIVGLSDEMAIALSAGGVMSLMACFVLLLKAANAPRHDHRDTEVWLMLAPHDRPHAGIAQRVIAVARRGALIEFALLAACLAAGQLTASLLWQALASS